MKSTKLGCVRINYIDIIITKKGLKLGLTYFTYMDLVWFL